MRTLTRTAWFVALAIVVAGVGASAAPAAHAAPAPDPGFAVDTIAGGLDVATSMAFLPDGRLLVAEKAGVVRLVDSGWTSATPVIDLTSQVNDYGDRGLLGIAVDPEFSSNGFIYLSYTYEHHAADESAAKSGRIARYVMVGDTAAVGSEHVLVGSVNGPGCAAGGDCIPNEGISHTMGDLLFGLDGTLFASLGEAVYPVTTANVRAQDVSSLAGKVLRVDRDGRGLATNPFFTGDVDDVASKVFAVGFRNPFRLGIDPTDGTLWAGDVGWDAYEELDRVQPGANYGWPCYEGPAPVPATSGWGMGAAIQATPTCQALYAAGSGAVTFPARGLDRVDEPSYTVVMGPVLGASWGSLAGRVVAADYSWGWVRAYDTDDPSADGATIAGAAGGTVEITAGPDGLLYLLDIWTGTITRLRPATVPAAAPCPLGTWHEVVDAGGGRCVATVDHDWGTSSPDGAPADGWTATWRGAVDLPPGTYDLKVTTSDHVRVSVDGQVALERWSEASEPTVLTERLTLSGQQHGVSVSILDAADVASLAVEFVPVASAGTTYVSDLPFTETANGWGPIERDESTGGPGAGDGVPLVAGGRSYACGLGVHASSRALVTVPVGCSSFSSWVALDDSIGGSGSVIFEARNGGTSASSGVVRGADDAVQLVIPVVGGSDLELLVDDGGDGNYLDSGAWGDAAFECGGAPSVRIEDSPTVVSAGSNLIARGVGTAPDGSTLSGEALQWTVIVHHCATGLCHQHPLTTAVGSDLSLPVPDHGSDEWTLEVRLTATSGNEQATTSVFVETENGAPPTDVPEAATVALFGLSALGMSGVFVLHRRARPAKFS